jgi:nucleolar protein 14
LNQTLSYNILLFAASDSEDEDQEEEESEEMEEDGEGEESGEEGEEDGEAESGESGEDDDADDDDEQGIEEYLMGDLENADDLEDAPDLGKSGRDRKEARNNFSNLGLEADEVTHLEPEEELPFVFGMPSTFEGFTQLLSNQSADRQKKIIGRLRASNHPSLHPNNKDKMKLFYTYLLQRVMYLAGSEGSASGIKMDQVDVLCAPLFELSQSMPEYAAEVARDFIVQIDESFKAKLADGSSDSAAPRLQWLLMFKMLGQIWPVSDKRHGVVTPLFLLMGQMLSMSRIANMADVMKLLLLSNIFHSVRIHLRVITRIYRLFLQVNVYLQFICEAKRYSAEPLNVLFTVLDSFSKDNGKPNLAGPILSPLAQLPTGLMKLACKKAPTYKPRIINIDRLRPKAFVIYRGC